MINFPGYKTKEQIFRGYNSTIYRGIRDSDNKPVIIKFLNQEYPSPEELSRFRREYEITDRLKGDGIINVYGLEKYNNSLIMILEDFGAESVSKILHASQITMIDKVLLAVKMTEILKQIHQQKIIHKDINPSNFVWNTKTGKVKIIDFGISTELNRETTDFLNLNVLEGTLSYISPEQTGRMNRSIDYRTDFYSLGVSFYEIFTGQLPFKGDDDVEIVHFHIARRALPPEEVNLEIPSAISDIIMKLLSKTVEERYQSASGLRNDLEYCLKELEAKGKIENFNIGQNDVSDRFQIPQKLYGREEEIAELVERFKNVVKGDMELLLVSGYSGIGKSSIIHEIQKTVVGCNGYFISGKFDKLEKNIPYNAIIQAFSNLIRQLLTKSQNQLEYWKESLLEGLGSNSQIITELIPEVENIIGSQSAVIELNPSEAQNRFQLVFCQFIKVFAKKNHPLVLFLDDLQWSDLSTLEILKYIFAKGEVKHLLIIGAYRDNEVKSDHPLMLMLEKIKNEFKNTSSTFHQLLLKPLKESAVNQLLSDIFHSSPEAVSSLSTLIFRKTNGNPFFINQVLNSLYHRGIFKFIVSKGCWVWDLKQIEEVEISDNVLEFLVQNLNQLPSGVQKTLSFASCIGSKFTLKILSLISEQSYDSTAEVLWKALENDLILPFVSGYQLIKSQKGKKISKDIDAGFRFLHDRIQQAVYSLIPEEDKALVHLKIGRLLLKSFTKTERIEHIFDLVNHLNMGRNLIKTKEERIELADLNFIAGKKAKKATAYSMAANYFEEAISLLSQKEWSSDSNKLFQLSLEEVESTFLSGDIEKAERICESLFKITANNLEHGSVSSLKAKILEHQGKNIETIDEIRKVLQLFDVSLPQDPEEINQKIGKGIGKMQGTLAKIPIEELVNLPKMKDKNKEMAMKLLFQVIPPAIQTYPPLFILAELIMFDISVTYGITAVSCKNFVDCGIIQGGMLGDYEGAYKFGETAFKLLEKFKADSLKSSVYFVFSNYISHWRVHYKESHEYLSMSQKAGLENGDIEHVAYTYVVNVYNLFHTGKNLEKCRSEAEDALVLLKKLQSVPPLVMCQVAQNMILELLLPPKEKEDTDYEKNDNDFFNSLKNTNNSSVLHSYALEKMIINYFLDDREAADKWSSFIVPFTPSSNGLFKLPDQFLFQSLILTQKWRKTKAKEQKQIMDMLADNLDKLKFWSDNCPENFSHKYYLLSAEISIIEDESLETTISLYKKANDAIGKDDFIHMRALINELQGDFWLSKGYDAIGKIFIQEAYYLYKQWGSNVILAKLEKKYPQCFIEYDNRTKKQIKAHAISTDSHLRETSSLDMISIIKSTQAISSEVKIEKLLKTLMETIIENAGAQHGSLLLKQESDNKLYIEAVKDADLEKIEVMQSLYFSKSSQLCPDIVQYVARTGKSVVLNNACSEGDFQDNDYILENQVKSVLCTPIIYQKNFKGVVYLENNLSENTFTPERLELIRILSSQASISIENARLYENLEEKVRERTDQLKVANDMLKELSLHDPLTKLHNRRYIYEFISEISQNFIKNKIKLLHEDEKRDISLTNKVFGIYLIDIDNFKEVNDTYGHKTGDDVLIIISELLKKMIRADDFIVRWGGEEFLLILNNTKEEYLNIFPKKVLEKIKKTPIKILDNKIIYKTCSIGCTKLPIDARVPDFLTLEQTINLSDFALYKAKEGGRDCSVLIELKEQININEDIIKYLSHISRETEINEDYINIEYIK